jgi:hypothetical protein
MECSSGKKERRQHGRTEARRARESDLFGLADATLALGAKALHREIFLRLKARIFPAVADSESIPPAWPASICAGDGK